MEKSCSQTLIDELERFGEDEPKHVLVLYLTSSGSFVMSGSTDSLTIRMGLLHMGMKASDEAFIKRDDN